MSIKGELRSEAYMLLSPEMLRMKIDADMLHAEMKIAQMKMKHQTDEAKARVEIEESKTEDQLPMIAFVAILFIVFCIICVLKLEGMQ